MSACLLFIVLKLAGVLAISWWWLALIFFICLLLAASSKE